jgi:hypothetical protein
MLRHAGTGLKQILSGGLGKEGALLEFMAAFCCPYNLMKEPFLTICLLIIIS